MEIKVCKAEEGKNKDAESKARITKNSHSRKYKEGDK